MPTTTSEFFTTVFKSMSDRIVLLAFYEQQAVAGSLSFCKELYGRYWEVKTHSEVSKVNSATTV